MMRSEITSGVNGGTTVMPKLSFSKGKKLLLFFFLIVLNLIIRFQVVSHEIGIDSFGVHILTNSLSEFGSAKWILSPLSFFGLYPLSYTSSVPFLISGMFQTTGMGMESIIFVYGLLLGILSVFSGYLFAKALYPENDLFQFISCFIFSLCPAVLTYTTWTIPTRGLFVILCPLILYLLLMIAKSYKFIPLVMVLAVFLYSTHHMFYFLSLSFVAFLFVYICYKFKSHFKSLMFVNNYNAFLIVVAFVLAFSIPFFTGKFLDVSRYSPIYISYARYIGILLPLGLGGLFYLISSRKKTFGTVFLLVNLILLTVLIYKQTYMKWFIPIFFSPLISYGLVNIYASSIQKKHIVIMLLLASGVIFSSYYQFIHEYEDSSLNKRYLDESTFMSGSWIKNNMKGVGISNDETFGFRIAAIAEYVHQITSSPTNNFIYGFATLDVSSYKYHSITSEDFYYNTGTGTNSIGQELWYNYNSLKQNPGDAGLTHYVENTNSNGYITWNHAPTKASLLSELYVNEPLLYDNGKVRIWAIS